MTKLKPVIFTSLRQTLDPGELGFKTTDDLEPIATLVGQERALEAFKFGIGMKSHRYNLYAMGPSGIGKRSLVRFVLQETAARQPTPNDWCYIHNFASPEKPIALPLPAGMGLVLQQDMKLLINELDTSILSVFESDEFNAGMQEIQNDFNAKREKAEKRIVENTKGIKVPRLYKERHQKEKELQTRFTIAVLEPLINKLKKKYEKQAQVVEHLTAIQQDILTHVGDFIRRDEASDVMFISPDNPHLIKYQINLLVDNSKQGGAPVVFEENPSYNNLISRVEHASLAGSMATNFTLIRPGSLHKANGGYLILQARKLKAEKHAWEALKRALFSRVIRIEPIEDTVESVRPVSLEPMPIPLNVKVVLMGDRGTYYSLNNHDPEFNELFKVTVDFDEQVDRNKRNVNLYARLIGTMVRREGLKPFSASAVAAIIDHSSRLAEDVEKLSTHLRSVHDLVLEADYWAGTAGKTQVDNTDVKRAVEAQVHRRDRTRELYYEDIRRNFILINTSDMAVGQINCLSVMKVGNFSYGHPTRVTAKARMGKDRILDIQREIKLAGPIHSKAGLTIANFLASRYIPDQTLYMSASISFEQIYGNLEGDSASVAELCALLSALANVPLKQWFAVTGSVNQCGEVQAVGGVNVKIEGFFDVCKARGLNGEHGVLIPAVNIKNLMLREDVVEAAKAGKFLIYPVSTVDEALSFLTDMNVGKRGKDGEFPKNSLNYLIEARLKLFNKNRNRERKKPKSSAK